MRKETRNQSNGFTIIELMIAIAISAILMTAVFSIFSTQQNSYLAQENVATMQQDLRTGMIMIDHDFKMAGYDPTISNNFSITNISPIDISGTAKNDITGHSAITMTMDLDSDSTVDGGETIRYYVYDFIAGDGHVDLARDSGAATKLLMENVQRFGMAFAFDNDLDGELDTYTAANPGATQNVIWAIDATADAATFLDTNIDTNLDGQFDINDSAGGAGSNEVIAGSALGYQVAPSRIRAVKIWILVEARQSDENFSNEQTYMVGPYVVSPSGNRRMRLLSTTIQCRNMELKP